MNVFADLGRWIPSHLDDALPKSKAPRSTGKKARQVNHLPEISNPWNLTACQAECLRQMCDGFATKQIAANLGLSRKTVDAHTARLLDRMSQREGVALTRVRAAVLWDRHTRKRLGDSAA